MTIRHGDAKVWFTSDTHFGHGNILKYSDRPFLSAEDEATRDANGGTWHGSPHRLSHESVRRMDNALIDGINSCVGPNDVLWHLGDFVFARDSDRVHSARAILERIRCRNVYLVWGNHDKRSTAFGNLFREAVELAKIKVRDQRIVLCHYAMAVWDGSHRATWQLYGHSHGSAEEVLDDRLPGRRSLDVGVDNAYRLLGVYRPFSFDEVGDILRDRPGSVIDHHGRCGVKGCTSRRRLLHVAPPTALRAESRPRRKRSSQ